MTLKCYFCESLLDRDFDRPLTFKGLSHVICSNEDCRTITALDSNFSLTYQGLKEHSKNGLKCCLDTQLVTDKDYFLIRFEDGTKEISHKDNLRLKRLENDL